MRPASVTVLPVATAFVAKLAVAPVVTGVTVSPLTMPTRARPVKFGVAVRVPS